MKKERGRRVDIKLGFTCNNCCKFCVQANKRDKYKNKTLERIKDILKESRKNHSSVVLTGGEPTMRNDLPKIIDYAKDLGFKKIYLQTNGRRFFYKKYCKKIIRKGVDIFGLALHGPNKKIHENLTNTKGSFDQTTQGIKNLVKFNQNVSVNVVITKINYKYLPKIADLLINFGVSRYQFSFIHINSIIANDLELIEEIVPRKKNVIPYVKKGLDKGIEANVKASTEAIPICFLENYKKCISEIDNIPTGSVYDAEYKIENFNKHRKTKGKSKAEKCKECKYYDSCEGPWKEYPQIFGWEEFNPIL